MWANMHSVHKILNSAGKKAAPPSLWLQTELVDKYDTIQPYIKVSCKAYKNVIRILLYNGQVKVEQGPAFKVFNESNQYAGLVEYVYYRLRYSEQEISQIEEEAAIIKAEKQKRMAKK